VETTATTRNLDSSQLTIAFEQLKALDLEPRAEVLRRASLDVAQIVRSLEADDDIVIAAMIAPLMDAKFLDRDSAGKRFGAEGARLARELNQLGEFGLATDWTPERGLGTRQSETLRKMLLAVIGDVRLVVVRLAEQLQKLRSAKTFSVSDQRRLAIETREVYAPLANRLGVWQLKWELEDLAFRYLQPTDYKHIAAALNVRRADREQYIEELTTSLNQRLREMSIEAVIDGRPKHIYSIWRKMQAKHLAFEQLMDVRAARIRVNSIADCYAALSVVHSLWPPIHGEFSDYIATPKDNLYRSIHTAVIGPGKQSVEIQIRTHEMHASSERGVAAHWRYKEGGRSNLVYEEKINRLRLLLAPSANDAERDFLERMRVGLFADRIYVVSPKGDIVDVPMGGTPLDFAYQVHTDLGHRTRGAKVNGRIVPLNYPLKNSETVEIITTKIAQPSRDWLAPRSGFIASARHRNKVRAWFRKHDGSASTASQPDESHAQRPAPKLRTPPVRKPHAAEPEVRGVHDMLSTYARCCKPVPPEPIVGYITVGRGVSIHARKCLNFAHISAKTPARVLPIAWDSSQSNRYPVDIDIRAFDRHGLVRDVSATLTDESISILGMTTATDKRDRIARMQISISIEGLPQLARVLAKILKLPNVISAKRQK